MFNEQDAKLCQIRADGVNPYPVGQGADYCSLGDISALRNCRIFELEQMEPSRLSGRLRFKNEVGSIGFGRIELINNRIQICIRKNIVSAEAFKVWKRLDIGDIIYAVGTLSRTRSGELTLFVTDITLASKCILSMPDKISGISDIETTYRQRYLHLAVSSEARNLFLKRSAAISDLRNILSTRDFVEVETPTLSSIPSGALARPFATHHNALNQSMFLRIAPELYLKRLLVGGFTKLFEISKCFRNEGIDSKHNPEFTTIEIYEAHATYTDLIKLVSDIISQLSRYSTDDSINFNNITTIRFDDALRNLGIENPWNINELEAFWLENKERLDNAPDSIGGWFQLIFDEFVQQTLIDPTFITNHPFENSPLARKSDDDAGTVDRFELYIRGMEVADGWTELNDPVEQAANFENQAKRRASGDEEAMVYDDDFINALSYGMPPAAGVGIGLDRLMMTLFGKSSIRDVILFPILRS